MRTTTLLLGSASYAVAAMAHLKFMPQIVFDAREVDIDKLAEEVTGKFTKAFDEVKAIAEKAIAEAKKGIELTTAEKEKADEALKTMNELKAQVGEIEQKLAREKSDEDKKEKTIGEQFTEGESFKQFQQSGFSKNARGADIKVKTTLTSLTTAAGGSVGDAINQTRLPGVLPLPQRRLTVRDLLSQGRMDGNTLEYVKETGFTNSAAPVAEAAAKPESDLQFDLYTTSAKVIAHWMKASRQVLSDISQLQSIIDQRLLFGLAYVEETQLLNGDGTGQNLNGIIPQATAYSAAFVVDAENPMDMVRLAMLQAALAEYPATGVVVHPTDWARIELTKDSQGRYVIGNPQGTTGATLWSLPVVATQAISVDKFLVGAFKLGAQIFDRWDARVETGYVNDDFVKNLITVLAEERLALAVYRPEAFIYGDFGNV